MPAPDVSMHTSPHIQTHTHGGNKYVPYQSAPSLTFQVGPLRKGGLVSAQFFSGMWRKNWGGERPDSAISFSWFEAIMVQDRGFPPTLPQIAPHGSPWTLQGREKQSAVLKANTDLVGSSNRTDGDGGRRGRGEGSGGGVVSPSRGDAHSNWCFPGQGGGGKRGQTSKREKCLLAAREEALGTQKRCPQQLVPKVPSPQPSQPVPHYWALETRNDSQQRAGH